MNIHLKTFLREFSYPLQGDKDDECKRKLNLKERIEISVRLGIKMYLPVINNIYFTATLIKEKRSGAHWNTPGKKAELTQGVICALGLGVFLMPMHLIATVFRKIFNATHDEKIFIPE